MNPGDGVFDGVKPLGKFPARQTMKDERQFYQGDFNMNRGLMLRHSGTIVWRPPVLDYDENKFSVLVW